MIHWGSSDAISLKMKEIAGRDGTVGKRQEVSGAALREPRWAGRELFSDPHDLDALPLEGSDRFGRRPSIRDQRVDLA
jgi:hypothetical protein